MNRTILILGDSVDRNGLEHLAVMLGLPRYSVPYDDYSRKGEVPKGWDGRGVPWVIHAPWLDLTLTNGFLYGLVRLPLFTSPSRELENELIRINPRTMKIIFVNNLIGIPPDWPKSE